MTSNTFSQKDQDFANAMATKLRLNREKIKQTLTTDEKINQLNPEQREQIGYQLFVKVLKNFQV